MDRDIQLEQMTMSHRELDVRDLSDIKTWALHKKSRMAVVAAVYDRRRSRKLLYCRRS